MTMHVPIIKNGGIALIALACGTAFQAASSGRETDTVSTAPAHAGCIDILRHGADRTGVQDSAAASRAAVAASDSRAICVYLPSGIYRFASSPTLTLRVDDQDAAIAIKGDGAGLSRLMFDAEVSGPVLRVNGPQQSFNIRDISILAGGKDKAATGLTIIQQGAPFPNPAKSDITGVTIRGKDGFGASYRFARGIYLHQVSNVILANTVITGSPNGMSYASQGTCLSMDGTATSIPVQINIVSSQINYCGVGLRYGPYLQGVQIIGSNFVGNGTKSSLAAASVNHRLRLRTS